MNCICSYSYVASYVFVIYICCYTVTVTGGTTLRELDVSNNDIGDNGILLITEWLLSNKTLTYLNVTKCNLSKKGTVLYKICKNFEIASYIAKFEDVTISAFSI